MPLTTQTIRIPLGGGLQEAQDPHRRGAPHADVAANAVVRYGESYQKAPGYVTGGTGGSTGTGGAKALIIDPSSRKLTVGQNGQAVSPSAGTAWATLASGYQSPTHIGTVAVASPRGHILDVGVSFHNAGWIGVVWREWIDPANPDVSDAWGPGRIAGLVMAEDGTVVAGPYYWEDMHFCPRVECCTDSGGVPVFYFLGLASEGDDLLPDNVSVTIRSDRIPLDSPPAAGELTSDVVKAGVDTATPTYDTHSVSSHNAIYIIYRLGIFLVCTRLSSAGVLLDQTIKTSTPPEYAARYQVYHNDATETVIITESYIWNTAFAVNEANTSKAEYLSLHAESYPRLYKHTTSAAEEVVFSGETITVVGTGPGALSLTGTEAYNIPPDCYDPQPWEGHDYALFPVPTSGGFYPDGPIWDLGTALGGSWKLNEELPGKFEGHFVHSNGLIYPQFDILSGRQSPLMWSGTTAGTPLGGAGTLSHVPQTAVNNDGVVLMAAHVRVPATKGYRLNDTSTLTNYTQDTIETQSEGHLPNMDRQVLVVTMSPNQEDLVLSTIDQDGTQVIAAGGVGFWDGQAVVNFVPQPRIVEYIRDTGSAEPSTGILMGTTGGGLGGLATGTPGQTDKLTALKIVVVYTDKNGVEWRSSPSPPVVYYELPVSTAFEYPRVVIDFNHLAYYRGHTLGGKFDVELYTTERDNGNEWAGPTGTEFADIVTEYYLAQRSPMLEDVDGLYIVDLLNFAHNGSFYYPALPLYTDTGELAPVVPPASGVLARSGGHAFLVPSEFPYELWASKPLEPGRGPEFCPELILYAPSDSGGIVSLAGLNDRLYILCRNGVYALSTVSGPDATGSGSFGPIRRIHTGDGCVNHNCTVETPAGVVFTSDVGVRLIGGDSLVQNLGRNAEDTIGDPNRFVRAVYNRHTDEVWLIAATDSVVLNLTSGAWTTEARTETTYDAEEVGGELCLLTDGGVRLSDVGTSLDVSASRVMSITTTWLTFDHAMGYFRAKRIHVLGRRESGASDIVIKLAYDYDDTVVDTFRFPYYGTDGVSNFERAMHFTVRPSVQKFDAVKITVTETATSGAEVQDTTPTLVWSLTGLEIELAAKQGGIKLQQMAKK